MSSDEPQIKYQEVSPFQISEGFTPTRSRKMEPVKTSRIFMAAVAANLSAFAVGTCLGWTSPIAPKLKSDDTSDSPLDHKIDSTDDAWIASVVALGALVAPFVAGPLADKIGRKWVLLSSSVFFVLAYVLMMIGGEVWVLLVARLIQGFGVGFVMTVQPMYVGEIATDSVRGATGSLMQLFIVSSLIAGPLTGIIGRKWVLLASSPIFIITFILMMIAHSVWIIILARTLQGIATGFVMTAQPIYVCEISTDSIRGATGSIMQLGIVTGVLYVYAIGPYVSYQALQWFCIAVPIIFTAIFVFMPESPHYYVSKKRYEEASKSLQLLRGQSAEAVKDVLVDIENFIQETAAHKGSVKDVFKTPGNRKALLISIALLAFQQLSGNTAVLFNTQSIFDAANTGTDSAISAIIVGIVQVAASALTPLLADRLGRKIILLICSAIMCIALFALGAYFYIELAGEDTSNILWLPFSALIIYIIFYSASFGPLPWVVLGEIFPANVKSAASSIATSCCLLTGFLISFFFPLLNELGSYYIFWLFAVSCAVAFIFILFVVFETKGLSLQEIQNKLNKRDTTV